MRSGVIAANYLDPLAVMMQSVRTGRNGRGWRRFLVFAELTKGRKGTEYVALFTYFSFEGKAHLYFRCPRLTRPSMVAHYIRRRPAASHQRVDPLLRDAGQSSTRWKS